MNDGGGKKKYRVPRRIGFSPRRDGKIGGEWYRESWRDKSNGRLCQPKVKRLDFKTYIFKFFIKV